MRSRLNERDLSRIVRRVINEGGFIAADMSEFPDGAYKMVKIQPGTGPTEKGVYFVKNGAEIQIVSGQVIGKADGTVGPYGGGSIYQ